MRFGATDCSAPIKYALKHNIDCDVFVVYTDNETWAGRIKPYEALRQYRKTINPNAKLVVVGMTSTGFTIADPKDGGMLDVVGFDSSAPAVISNFARE
jgi:60 kDa SS-A/Ro ribonucleoprotein